MSAPPPTITFLSDYGTDDEYVGVCHAVIARRCPGAHVIDLAHGIPRGDIRAGAIVLRGALAYAAAGVHLAVIDPGVGGPRRAIALQTNGGVDERRLLVGPDNGLLIPAAESLGGVAEAVALDSSPERLLPVSATFHGRDVFAPVAAALASGAALGDVGEPVGAASLTALRLPSARLTDDGLQAHVLHRDRFGNVMLDVDPAQLQQLGLVPWSPVSVKVVASAAAEPPGAPLAARRGTTFADVAPGELVLYLDSLGLVALAVNGGSAASLLGVGPDDEVVLAAPSGGAEGSAP